MPDVHVPKIGEHSGKSIGHIADCLKELQAYFRAFGLSGIYNVQSILSGENQAFAQGMFVRPPTSDETAYFASLQAYFGDMSYFEPRLLSLYDQTLQKIDKALGEK